MMNKLGIAAVFASFTLFACANAVSSGDAAKEGTEPVRPSPSGPSTSAGAPAEAPLATATATATATTTSTGHVEEPPPKDTKTGQLFVMQADHDTTTVMSFAYKATLLIAKPTPFGACQLRRNPTFLNTVALEPPKEFVFTGGNSLSPLSLLPLPGTKTYRYDDSRNLGMGGTPTWLAGGETLSATSAATIDTPAISFPALAWPSRVLLASSPTFVVSGGAGARTASNVAMASDLDIAWTVDDAVDAGTTHVEISRQDNTVAIDCMVPTSDHTVKVSPAALAALGVGPAYLFISSYNHTTVNVAGYETFHYTLDQFEAGRKQNGPTRSDVTFAIQ